MSTVDDLRRANMVKVLDVHYRLEPPPGDGMPHEVPPASFCKIPGILQLVLNIHNDLGNPDFDFNITLNGDHIGMDSMGRNLIRWGAHDDVNQDFIIDGNLVTVDRYHGQLTTALTAISQEDSSCVP